MPKRTHINKTLLRAVLEPRKKEALQKITDACAEGADPNHIVPDSSTSTGHVRGGSTLLTHSVHECASRVVDKLLECGADPNLADNHGWTPWVASTLTDDSKRERIQESLLQHGAKQQGDHIGSLVRAIADGDAEKAASLFKTEEDTAILSTFRVDLIGHSIRNKNNQVLELLLNKNMPVNHDHLSTAVRANHVEGVEMLLRHNVAPENASQDETLLMTTASAGNLEIVKLLVDAGADINKYAQNNTEWTAAFYARRAGKTEVADWLASKMDRSILKEQQEIDAARNPKFRVLYEQATASENLSTEEIVTTLEHWDDKYNISIDDVSYNHIKVNFSSLPENFDRFYQELEKLCSDSAGSRQAVEKELKNSNSLLLWWD